MVDVKYSIIVAVYNVEKYIDKCLKSLLHQDFEQYEVIVVDDGSNDNTFEIVSQYKTNDRLKIIRQVNKGTARARIEGVIHASGEYVLFVDGDDYIKNTSISLIDSYVESTDADIYQYGYIRDYGIYRNNVGVPNGQFEDVVNDESIVKAFFGGGNEKISVHVTSKVYKIELLRGIIDAIDEHIVYGEDVYINLMVFFEGGVKSICSVDNSWYYYRQGVGAMSKLNLSLLSRYQQIRTIQSDVIKKYELSSVYTDMMHTESMNILRHHSAMTISSLSYSVFVEMLAAQLNTAFLRDAIHYFGNRNENQKHIDYLIRKDYLMYYECCKQYFRELGIISRIKYALIKKILYFSR